MALFKKEICPVCGNLVKGMFNAKIKDKQTLCTDCSSKIKMDFSMLPFQTAEDIKEHLIYRERNLELFNKFSVSKEIQCGTSYFREDDKLGKWYLAYDKKPINPALFDYNEIIDYELTEDGEQVVKGGMGSAVAGGLLFGGVGAVVGSNVGKKTSRTVIKSMNLRISLNNKYKQQIDVDFLPPGMEVKIGSGIYGIYKAQANNAISFLDTLCSKANVTMSSIRSAAVSSADEILKFKNLLDAGIITPEEFEAKKKELLNL